jgi:UDP-N-acetylmuramoyl-tripeptide--D-alanyl-D-alanine ligase
MLTFSIQDLESCFYPPLAKDLFFSGVSVDSRLHKKENLFFALPGNKTSGEEYLSQIAQTGSPAVVVSTNYQGNDFGLILIRVDDPLLLMQNLASKLLKRSGSRVVAVTGSVGKTTTKEFIFTLLKDKFKTSASPGNSNSQIGVPLTILNHLKGDEEIVILEMGMSVPGQIKRLTEIAPPECAILTAAELVHACNFTSVEEIGLTKGEILCHPQTKLGIVNRDIVNYEDVVQLNSSLNIQSFSYNNTKANFTVFFKELNFDVFPIPGKHNISNFLAAVLCARYFGLDWHEIQKGMNRLVLPELRGQKIEKNGILFINDCYNAAPASVKAALETIPQPYNAGRKIAVFSDMLELGEFSEKCHREIGNHALNFVDFMFCYGMQCQFILDCWQEAKKPVEWFSDRKSLIEVLHKNLKKDDVVLIKGSRGTEIYKLLDELELLSK